MSVTHKHIKAEYKGEQQHECLLVLFACRVANKVR